MATIPNMATPNTAITSAPYVEGMWSLGRPTFTFTSPDAVPAAVVVLAGFAPCVSSPDPTQDMLASGCHQLTSDHSVITQ